MTANSLLPATDCALACPGDPQQKCGGPCLSTVSKIDCRGLGWTLVGLILGGGAGTELSPVPGQLARVSSSEGVPRVPSHGQQNQ